MLIAIDSRSSQFFPVSTHTHCKHDNYLNLSKCIKTKFFQNFSIVMLIHFNYNFQFNAYILIELTQPCITFHSTCWKSNKIT